MNAFLNLITAATLVLSGAAEAGDSAPQSAARDVQATAVIRLSALQQDKNTRLLNGVPFTGTVDDFYPDGVRKARFQLVDGKAEGAWVEWHPDGAIRFYSEWRAGKGDGPFVYFHPNGEISERVTARADIWDGVAEGWQPDGRKAFERVYRAGKLVSEKRFSDVGKE